MRARTFWTVGVALVLRNHCRLPLVDQGIVPSGPKLKNFENIT